MSRLNHNQRIRALTMLSRGDNVSKVSRAFGCHRNTIIRLRQRFQQTSGVTDRQRDPVDRGLQTLERTGSLRRLRLARQPIRPRRPYVGQVLTAHHRAARLQWAQRHFRWGRQQWARVLFSDES